MSNQWHKKKDIPDRWLDYKGLGDKIVGTPFIAFKVPLHQVSSICWMFFVDWMCLKNKTCIANRLMLQILNNDYIFKAHLSNTPNDIITIDKLFKHPS